MVETFLILKGMEISASVDEQERIVLAIAAGDFLAARDIVVLIKESSLQ